MDRKSSKFWVSVTENREMTNTFHASFCVPDEPPRWVTDRGNRKVFTSRNEAKLAGHEMMVAHLNDTVEAEERSAAKTGTKIRSFREGGQVKNRGRKLLTTSTAEADAVFANFKG